MQRKRHFAVIVVGSNDLTMKVAELGANAKLKVVERLHGALALGEDTFETGRISDAFIIRTCEILKGFRNKLGEYGLSACRVVGTSAVREADNRDYVLNRVARTTGFHIEILDSSVESCFRLLAALESLSAYPELKAQDMQVIDIGAGYVHQSYFSKNRLLYSQSAVLGALRISGILEQLRLSVAKPMEAFEEYLDNELRGMRVDEQAGLRPDALVVIGSETKHIKRIAGIKRNDFYLRPEEFEAVLELLGRLKPHDLTLRYGVPPERCRQLLPAALIIKKYLQACGARALYMPNANLCRGLLYEHAALNFSYPMVGDKNALVLSQADGLAARFRSDEVHSGRVEAIALLIFDALKKSFSMTERQRLYLRLVARLMHVGAYIRQPHHGALSYGIIRDLDLLGVTQKECQRIARIAEYANVLSFPKRSDMLELPGGLRQEIIALAAIARVAECLTIVRSQALNCTRAKIKGEALQIFCELSEDSGLENFLLPLRSRLFREIFGLEVQLCKEQKNESQAKKERR